jgi:aquaporin Z
MEMKKYIAEFIGTFFLLFVGTGAIIVNHLSNNALGHMGIAFAFVIAVLIYALGHISGAHFNPAVTIAFSVVGKFSKTQVVPYIASQLLGALGASAVLKMFFGNICDMGGTFPALPIGSSLVSVSFITEFIFTFLLMFVIMSVATDSRAENNFAGLTIGLTVLIGAAVAGPISGGSFNPARSIAPAVVSGNLDHLVSPVIGAICAALLYTILGSITSAQAIENSRLQS